MNVEVCVDSVESAVEAQKGGAKRVELCSSLFEGGLTPSLGLVHHVRKQIRVGLHVMIRPRQGDFCYTEDEFQVMKMDIQFCKDAQVDGLVFGILTAKGEVDVERTGDLVNLCKPLPVTFHRAFGISIYAPCPLVVLCEL